jgi:hypothetical protein
MFGELAGILLLIGDMMDHAGRIAAVESIDSQQAWRGDAWLQDPSAFAAAMEAAWAALEAARPAGEPASPAEPNNYALMLVSLLANNESQTMMQVKEVLSHATLKRITKNAKHAASGAQSNE